MKLTATIFLPGQAKCSDNADNSSTGGSVSVNICACVCVHTCIASENLKRIIPTCGTHKPVPICKNLGVFNEVLAPLCHSHPPSRPRWHLTEIYEPEISNEALLSPLASDVAFGPVIRALCVERFLPAGELKEFAVSSHFVDRQKHLSRYLSHFAASSSSLSSIASICSIMFSEDDGLSRREFCRSIKHNLALLLSSVALCTSLAKFHSIVTNVTI